jgi:hypothetical protein
MKGKLFGPTVGVALWLITSPAVAQMVVSADVRGAGSVEVFSPGIVPTGESGHFGFTVEEVTDDTVLLLQLSALNRVTQDRVEIDSALVTPLAPNLFVFEGPCTVDNEPGVCFGLARDGGEPGSNDLFQLSYDSPGGTGEFSGPLLSGNVEILFTFTS